nr:hypothetical protein [uncultured Mediterraneibacter sp.]
MDEMKINIGSKILKTIVSKIIANAVYKQIGYRPLIDINELEATMADGKIRFHINASGELDKDVLYKVNRLIE